MIYHDVCRQNHVLFPPRAGDAIAIGAVRYVGWVRCGGVMLHVYERGRVRTIDRARDREGGVLSPA